ncbi:ribose 5-phosphate isomerase B [Chloroflexota bacterium]
MQRIIIGSDHVGYSLKEPVLAYLKQLGEEVVDAGPFDDQVAVEYPVYAEKVSQAVVCGDCDCGIVICGTGIGVSIAANKMPGARAALCHNAYTAHQARAHNDANILAMGAWIVSVEQVEDILDEWLNTVFEYGRHIPRVNILNRGFGNSQLSRLHPQAGYPYKFGVSLSLKQTSFGPVLYAGKLEEGMKCVADLGLDYVEVSLRNPGDIDIGEIIKLQEKFGIKVYALATGQGCIEDGLCLCASKPEKRAMAIKRMQKIAEIAANLDAKLIIGGVRGSLMAKTSVERAEQYALSVDAVCQITNYASALGVSSLLEPINRYELNFVNSIADGLRVIEEVANDDLTLLVDTFHMNIEEADLAASIIEAGNQVGYVHFADSNRHAPGRGHIDFQSVLDALRVIDYKGPISAEILPLPSEEKAMQDAAEYFLAL